MYTYTHSPDMRAVQICAYESVCHAHHKSLRVYLFAYLSVHIYRCACIPLHKFPICTGACVSKPESAFQASEVSNHFRRFLNDTATQARSSLGSQSLYPDSHGTFYGDLEKQWKLVAFPRHATELQLLGPCPMRAKFLKARRLAAAVVQVDPLQ